ncbi:hypothetical protein [uncultured Arthrobacter sp.]|uniref:hypothetical protein n=1 Tax=uncultured Arthrobacter sp. TaxID=114050 RepID=UPI002629294B|nr:hypothetical protein [uncultured Arthrobacter sp.]
MLFTPYAGKYMGTYIVSEMRNLTDAVDEVIAAELGFTDLLPALEHAYACTYKSTGNRPGTLRRDPFANQLYGKHSQIRHAQSKTRYAIY